DKKEDAVLSFDFSVMLTAPGLNVICKEFFNKTGQKLSIIFEGSKGYINRIIFEAEGSQTTNKNKFSYVVFSKAKGIGDHKAEVYFNQEEGVRIYIEDQEEIVKQYYKKNFPGEAVTDRAIDIFLRGS